MSPLFLCVLKQNLNLLELMYRHSPNEYMDATNCQGLSALMFAAEQNLKNMVNYLSLRTKNLNIEDSRGKTIVMHMILQHNYKMVSRLLYRGARIDYVNKFGKTALHVCVESKLEEAVKYLLFKGANQHILDFDELDCCDKAKANGLAKTI